MGAAASIDNQSLNNIDYQTLRSAGLNFASAHSALESKILLGKSVHSINDVSLFAIRQLSQNLRNQDDLERTRRKVLKSRSLPDNLNYHQKYYDQKGEDEYFAVKDEFDQDDLDLIDDAEFVVTSSQVSQPPTPVQTEKKKVKKPMLSLMVTSSGSFGNVNEMKEAYTPQPHVGEEQVKPLSPSAQARISPHGTLYMGKYKIKETGIFPDVDPLTPNGEMIKNEFKSFEDEFSWDDNTESTRMQEDVLPALGGKQDFVEIATLGSGASGVVTESMHVPSLTIVALKMLPVYNQEKRQSVSRELAVLYQNLTEMRLVDESLNGITSSEESQGSKAAKCPNVLSLYNAFIDPKSGMINLVVEYMDGGSLEDLVKQGGCSDERVLADLSYQTLNGLAYLHRNKSIHRDIKPANILCSSSGVIKIADFGISKALDKSTGFANSFVGTVCYMSPERITGDSYSFSCDIWSFGLTLLAVAKGRFPITLSDNGEDAVDNTEVYAKGPTVIGGPQGYWAMMKAICDDQPPIAGKRFSEQMNDFIDKCLQKDPQNRHSAQELMDHVFVIANSDKSLEGHKHGYDTSEPSLLMNRLTAVTIAKTTSRDVNQEESRHDRGIDLSPIEEEMGQDEKDIIYSIRMEHLDRLLDKLKSKICDQQKGIHGSKPPETPTKFEDLKWASSPSIISTVQSKPFDFGSLNSSVESLDNLVLPREIGRAKLQLTNEDYKSPEKEFGGDKQRLMDSSQHSILKANSSFRRDDADRKLNASNITHNSSSRSVHFIDENDAQNDKSFKKSFRKKPLLAPLNLGVINDNDNELEEDTSFCLDLPKTSSYFSNTKNIVSGGASKAGNNKRAVLKVERVDYNRMVPKLNKRGMLKWQNLARQLHLPLGIVLVAARDKLGRLVDLDAED